MTARKVDRFSVQDFQPNNKKIVSVKLKLKLLSENQTSSS
jgi:hypothetical protein